MVKPLYTGLESSIGQASGFALEVDISILQGPRTEHAMRINMMAWKLLLVQLWKTCQLQL